MIKCWLPNTASGIYASEIMHTAIQLSLYWLLAFASLGGALVSLNIYFSSINNGLEFRSVKSEIFIAVLCSLIEAAAFWLIVTYASMAASRAMILPALIVALIYKVAHYQDWARFDIFMLLLFQVIIALVLASLFLGQFAAALLILVGFGFVLGIIAFFAESLWGD